MTPVWPVPSQPRQPAWHQSLTYSSRAGEPPAILYTCCGWYASGFTLGRVFNSPLVVLLSCCVLLFCSLHTALCLHCCLATLLVACGCDGCVALLLQVHAGDNCTDVQNPGPVVSQHSLRTQCDVLERRQAQRCTGEWAAHLTPSHTELTLSHMLSPSLNCL